MRYLPLTPDDRAAMLRTIGAPTVEALFADVPTTARREGLVDLPAHLGELEVERELSRLARRNLSMEIEGFRRTAESARG